MAPPPRRPPRERPPSGGPSGAGRRGGAPAARPLTAERIRAIAEHYVAQRESSAGMLRSVLERRLLRRLRGLDPEEAAREREAATPLIEAEVERLRRAGILDDARYAEGRARAALAGGRGARRILRDLGQKGVEGETARAALLGAAREVVGAEGAADHDGEAGGDDPLGAAEIEAARVFARKRRLGPFRAEPLPEPWAERSRVWRREAGAMARAGFGVDTIRRVLDGGPEEE